MRDTLNRWQLCESEAVATTPWLRIERNRYLREGQETKDYYILRRAAFVVVVAVDESERVILLREYRPATDTFYLALPAGYVAPGEDPEQAAVRELREETGAVGRNWCQVGHLDPLPGYIESRAHVFRCDVSEVDPCTRVLEDGAAEHAPLVRLHRRAVREAIVRGEINEMQAVSAFLLTEAVEDYS
jgi:8-oxo-dGTP pyrophosphatase MutT (NUDIX family)